MGRKKSDFIEKAIVLFSEHIGEEKGISSRDLFKEAYDVFPETLPKYELFFKVICLQRALNYLRRKTYAFVVHKGDKYFVVTNKEEAQDYVNKLNSTKKKIDYMLKRLDEAIDEKFYIKLKKKKVLVVNN